MPVSDINGVSHLGIVAWLRLSQPAGRCDWSVTLCHNQPAGVTGVLLSLCWHDTVRVRMVKTWVGSTGEANGCLRQ